MSNPKTTSDSPPRVMANDDGLWLVAHHAMVLAFDAKKQTSSIIDQNLRRAWEKMMAARPENPS